MRYQKEGILHSAYIFLHHKRLKQKGIPDRVVQWSTWVVFLWRPIKVPLVCGFSPSLRMITLKNPYLFASPGPTNITTMTRQHTQFPLTFVYSLAPRPLAFYESLIHRDKKGVSQIHSPVSGVNFSNNISIPQV